MQKSDISEFDNEIHCHLCAGSLLFNLRSFVLHRMHADLIFNPRKR